jgi:hypothetical protein
MSYNKINKLLMYKKVIGIVKEHYEEGLTTYMGVYKKYVNPVYPMSYNTFMKIVGMSNIDRLIEEEKKEGGVISD